MSMNVEAVTIGCDPEVILRGDNGYVSAIGLIGGSKDEPRSVPNGMLQEDNVLAEFGISPAKDENEFVRNIKSVLGSLEATIKPHKLKMAFVPSAVFDSSQLKHPAACVFGCEPDYNAWTISENPAPSPDAAGNMRTAGGHVHVGFEAKDEYDPIRLVRMMDLMLGVPSVLMDPDTGRRNVYGRAGAHRPKPYGVEYRTLSNFWVGHEVLMRWVYKQTMKAVDNRHDDDLIDMFGGEVIQRTINESDIAMAQQIVDAAGIDMPKAV